MRGAAQRSSWRPAVAARAQRQRLAPLAAARGRCSLPTRQLDAPLLLLPLPLLQGLLAAVARWHLRPACLLEPRGGLWEASLRAVIWACGVYMAAATNAGRLLQNTDCFMSGAEARVVQHEPENQRDLGRHRQAPPKAAQTAQAQPLISSDRA